jgi:hypothetical protein
MRRPPHEGAGDVEKVLRRSDITGALVCSRNPKLVAAEPGHATSHRVVDNYDSLLGPRTWPESEKIDRCARSTAGRPWSRSASWHAVDAHRVPAREHRTAQLQKRLEVRGMLARREGLEPPTPRFEACPRGPKRLRDGPRIPLRALRSRGMGPVGTHGHPPAGRGGPATGLARVHRVSEWSRRQLEERPP